MAVSKEAVLKRHILAHWGIKDIKTKVVGAIFRDRHKTLAERLYRRDPKDKQWPLPFIHKGKQYIADYNHKTGRKRMLIHGEPRSRGGDGATHDPNEP